MLVKGSYLLQKFSGKAGWTYIEVPEIKLSSTSYFGEVEVSGKIDDYSFTARKLLSMGNGRLFLPVKAEIRKHIEKQAGDVVELELSFDDEPENNSNDILVCFENEPPETYQKFLNLPESQRQAYLDHISAAKIDEVRIQRIIRMMDELSAIE